MKRDLQPPATDPQLFVQMTDHVQRLAVYRWTGSTGSPFRRGDANDDGVVDVTDPIVTLVAMLLGDFDITCLDAADSNDDGNLDITDPINTLSVLFLGQGAIPAPGRTDCGGDPTDDALDCELYTQCE